LGGNNKEEDSIAELFKNTITSAEFPINGILLDVKEYVPDTVKFTT
jgi:hypothetical protein